VAVDTDGENPALQRFHTEAELVGFNRALDLDLIVEPLEQRDLVVVDWRTASAKEFLERSAEFQWLDVLQGLHAELTSIIPIDQEPDCVKQIRALMKQFSDDCRYVIVRNRFPTGVFFSFDQSKTRTHLLKKFRAREIFMPKLYERVVTKINSEDVTITRALHHPAFSTIDRQRLRHWQRIFYDQLDAVQEFVLARSLVQDVASRTRSALRV
jgi:hypothetical protein